MLSLVLSIVLGAFAGMLLKGFYSMVKREEPASYTYSVSKRLFAFEGVGVVGGVGRVVAG